MALITVVVVAAVVCVHVYMALFLSFLFLQALPFHTADLTSFDLFHLSVNLFHLVWNCSDLTFCNTAFAKYFERLWEWVSRRIVPFPSTIFLCSSITAVFSNPLCITCTTFILSLVWEKGKSSQKIQGNEVNDLFPVKRNYNRKIRLFSFSFVSLLYIITKCLFLP